MATLAEVETALGVIAYGLMTDESALLPCTEGFLEAYTSVEGRRLLGEKVTLLHCTTEYPVPSKDINLNAMLTMRDMYNLKVGYSDHSEGIAVSTAAAALGAKVIEKHFTLDKSFEGPDHKASLALAELKIMVTAIRTVELAMGDGVKKAMESELQNRSVVRKSLVAAIDIRKGQVFTEENLTIKRPGTGLSPFKYWELLGQLSSSDYMADEVVAE